ncbi:MAG: pyridoxal 5'-phosphate synthase glutaminase subunit PdxT, partial [Gaiellaceae bacterium]
MAGRVGVLALQGAFREHIAALHEVGLAAVEVRQARDMEGLYGLVIPGGESSTMSKLIET